MATVRPFARIALFLTVASMGALLADGAAAQARDIGKYEFDTYCALCHGKDAKGGGPFSGLVNKKVPDLTVLSKNNGGVFPFLETMMIIDGRTGIRGHGGTMPIWGDTFEAEGVEKAGVYGAETIARGRLLSLVEYLATLQQD